MTPNTLTVFIRDGGDPIVTPQNLPSMEVVLKRGGVITLAGELGRLQSIANALPRHVDFDLAAPGLTFTTRRKGIMTMVPADAQGNVVLTVGKAKDLISEAWKTLPDGHAQDGFQVLELAVLRYFEVPDPSYTIGKERCDLSI